MEPWWREDEEKKLCLPAFSFSLCVCMWGLVVQNKISTAGEKKRRKILDLIPFRRKDLDFRFIRSYLIDACEMYTPTMV
jgi:hypothetical protein